MTWLMILTGPIGSSGQRCISSCRVCCSSCSCSAGSPSQPGCPESHCCRAAHHRSYAGYQVVSCGADGQLSGLNLSSTAGGGLSIIGLRRCIAMCSIVPNSQVVIEGCG